MYRFLGVSLLVVVLGLAGAGTASAQGFGVYEQGACMMGRGGAGVADPCPDGSGIFFNPAALSLDAKVITFGGVIINPRGDFTDTSNTSMKGTVSTLNNKYYPVPNIYMSLPFAKKYAFGVGVFAPYGLTTDWPEKSQGRLPRLQERRAGALHPADVRREAQREGVGRRRRGRDLSERRTEPARGPLDPDAAQRRDLRRARRGGGHRLRRHPAEGPHAELRLSRRRHLQGERPVLLRHALPGRPEGGRPRRHDRHHADPGRQAGRDAVHDADLAARDPGRHADGRAGGAAVRHRRQAERPDRARR